MEDETGLEPINHELKINMTESCYKLRLPKKTNSEIVVGQEAPGSTFRLTRRSIARLRSSGVLAFAGLFSEQDITTAVQ